MTKVCVKVSLTLVCCVNMEYVIFIDRKGQAQLVLYSMTFLSSVPGFKELVFLV